MRLIHKADQYLKGEMSNEENDNFTEEIVQEYFEKEKLKKHWGNLLEEKHNFASKSNSLAPAKSNSNIVRMVAFATSIAASLLFVFYFFAPGDADAKQLSAIDKILNEHYAVPLTRTMLKGSNDMEAQRTQAFEFYNGREFEKAIPILASFVNDNTANEDDYFYLGLSYLYNNQPARAIAPLQHILNQDGMQRKDATTWYLSLAYTDSDHCENAKPLLNKVASWKGNKGKQKLANSAKELLDVIAKEGCNMK